MKVLWVAPWGRPLASVYAAALRAQGHEVLVVTSGRHYEQAPPGAPAVVEVAGSLKQPRAWGSVARAVRAARALRPDVVVTEELTDARLYPLLLLAPVAVLVHDDAPHDETEVPPLQHRVVARRTAARADLRVTYSAAVAGLLGAGAPVVTVPLPSEAPAALVGDVVPAAGRRDVVVLGRINPYKDVPTTLAAWAQHVAGPGYRGDELVVVGDGNEAELTLPPHCTWRRERFQFADVVPLVARAKAVVVHYRSASQSGVQVTAMQCGTAAVVSDAGGLAEYLPPGQHPVPVGDVAGLARALDALADPEVAAAAGAASRAHHDRRFTPAVAARALVDALAAVARVG